MFIVMFTVIILSIITLGFTRVVVSEALKTSNTDLSQSAYDSALAGIEDAKTALLKYHACLDRGYGPKSNGYECEKIIYNMQHGIATEDCSTVEKVLGRSRDKSNNAVIIQETQDSDDPGNNANMLQAYTCVTIQEELEDYRTTLDSESRLRIIPIRSSDLNSIKKIQLSWYSLSNAQRLGKYGYQNYCNNNSQYVFPSRSGCNDNPRTPPVITARLIQSDEEFNLSEFSASNSNNVNNPTITGTNTGQLTFIPKNSTTNTTVFAGNESLWPQTANKASSISSKDDMTSNKNDDIKLVNCKVGNNWSCVVEIDLPKTFNLKDTRSLANTYLLVSLPYGEPDTDISVKAYDSSNSPVSFTGVQARVDSTGRANDLFRRVETRIELIDTYFSYPEFEITMTGNDSKIQKSFYVTYNCWKSDTPSEDQDQDGITDPDTGIVYSTCNDYEEALKYSNL